MNDQQVKKEMREVEKELTRRMDQEKFRFYEPTGVGEKFINMVADPDNFMSLFSAANGIGKTAAGANICANMFWDSENKFFQHDFFQDFPHRKRGRIISDPTNLDKNIIPELKFWFPPEGKYYETSKNNKSYESVWRTSTGHEFDLMTYEQDPKEFEGVTLGWAWFDEPPPESILKATISRMRKGGTIFITATPLEGSAYLYDMFASGDHKVVLEGEGDSKIVHHRKVDYIEADVESACKVHGTRGFLDHEDIVNMVAEYDESERQARIYGKFQHLIGMVFKNWDPQVHVIEPFDITEDDYCVYNMLDPHPRTPDAVQWIAIDRNNTKYVVDELFTEVHSDKQLAQKIKRKDSQYRTVKRLADPLAFNKDQHDPDDSSLAKKLRDHGLKYQKASKNRTAADRRIRDALSHRKKEGHMVQAPELYVFSDCERTIYSIEHYRWDEWSGKTADKKDPKQKPIDKDDHMVENLGRCLITEPQFEPVDDQSWKYSEQSFDPYDK